MGIELNTTYDSIIVSPLGKYVPKIHTLNTYHDHRMAMAFATLASAYGTLTIDDKAVVNLNNTPEASAFGTGAEGRVE